jgi:hypothetical protein
MQLEQPGFSVAACSTGSFERLLRATSAVCPLLTSFKRGDPGLEPAGNLANGVYNFFGENLEKI